MTGPVVPASGPATVAVVGLGAMGGPAAAALGAAGHRVRGADPSARARDRAAGAGVDVHEDPAAAVRGAELVLLSLPTPAVVLTVIDELADALADRVDGVLVADLSTTGPEAAREAAARVRAAGGRFVDAPILGRPAACGRWTLVCGGDATDVDRLRALSVGVLAAGVERIGAVGAGATLKVLNNLMFGAINAVTAEVVDLAERAGLDPARFAAVVAGSGAATVSPLFADLAPRMAARDYAPTFTVDLLAKDVGLGVRLADGLGVEATVSRTVARLTAAASAAGLGARDTAALVEPLRDRPADGPADPAR
ncbi:3-hydroxyisobutyrate dehydrogenase [Friedmanniella endophytica]|uniref:3-hydroxyisobutyrate dehydrogenase n=1 Tax=Microlunatus kandeliicorticis TaxID=1759536 RepID=A0A7W3IV11_9ACTN|nr:NAD-binding protein [Microlunatus kandeliicorticis]MBA8795786.1 3-hydroxyisobutyrate dehydrogenase [Microlunatus kandeliicorticis]